MICWWMGASEESQSCLLLDAGGCGKQEENVAWLSSFYSFSIHCFTYWLIFAALPRTYFQAGCYTSCTISHILHFLFYFVLNSERRTENNNCTYSYHIDLWTVLEYIQSQPTLKCASSSSEGVTQWIVLRELVWVRWFLILSYIYIYIYKLI